MFRLSSTRFSTLACALCASLLLLASGSGVRTRAQAAQARTPSETVREFFKALHEKRFREALSISIYKPAIDGLSAKDFEELRPEFEAMATDADKVEITGEQISGDSATVFVKVPDDNGAMQPSKVDLMKLGGAWIVGEPQNEKAIREAGKDYFFNVRIQVNETDAQDMMVRIIKAQLVHGSQNGGLYADIPTLVKEGLLPKDIETTASTGYKYHLKLGGDKKTYTAGAEPEQYGRTGRVSFYLDTAGLQRKDVGGKPLTPDKK